MSRRVLRRVRRRVAARCADEGRPDDAARIRRFSYPELVELAILEGIPT